VIRKKKRGLEEYPYRKRKSLMSEAELKFYNALEKAVPEGEIKILSKVRILDIVEPTKRGYLYMNKISSKHIDFLLCKKEDMSPALAIELDDSTHEKRKERDNFKNKVMEVSGLQLERFKVKGVYEKGSIEDRIKPYLNLGKEKV
jgi:hypothetical protein